MDNGAVHNIDSYADNNSYDYIYYGTWDNSPIKWRVLTASGGQNNGMNADKYAAAYTNDGDVPVADYYAMFLLSEDFTSSTNIVQM